MLRVRRTRYAFFTYHDGLFPDIHSLLRGRAKTITVRQILALSALTGAESAISSEDLSILYEIPSDCWVESDGLEPERVTELARKGLLVTDDPEEELAELRRRDEQLAANQWNVYGALYHFLTKWHGIDIRKDLAPAIADLGELQAAPLEAVRAFLDQHGSPPPPFHSAVGALETRALPPVERGGPLYELLLDRRTTRSFNRTAPLCIDELSAVLHYVFGCHGYAPIVGDLVGLKKTSPSGGALHPIEVYPLVSCVDDLEPGLYHYAPRDHSLELLERLDASAAVELATQLTCGQDYFGSAHVTLLMTARFYRSFWKYRKHRRVYGVLLMDAAHLSQTLQLVATELGLGAYVTAAINGGDIEERLELDGTSEGAIAVCGFGRPGLRTSLEPDFLPYVPGETVL